MSNLESYCEFFSNIEDKLDYITYNPHHKKFLKELRDAHATELETEFNLNNEFIDPSDSPHTEFDYIGLKDVEKNTGAAHPKKILGSEIHSKSHAFKKNQIIFGRLRPYLNKATIIKKDGVIGSSEFYVVTPKKDTNADSDFFLRYLLSSFVLKQTKWLLTGSSYPRLSETDFKKILICLPKNQEKILKNLKSTETEISFYKESIAKETDNINNSFTQKFGIKIPECNTLSYWLNFSDVSTRLNYTFYNPAIRKMLEQMEKQEYKMLGEIIEDENGDGIDYGVNAYGKDKNEIPFINIENLNRTGEIDSENIKYIENAPKEKKVKENDILVSRSRQTGVWSLVTKNEEDFSFGSYILRMRIKENTMINPLYLVHYLNSDLGRTQISWLKTGSTGYNINPNQLRQLRIMTNQEKTEKILKVIKKSREKIKTYKNAIKTLETKLTNTFESNMLKGV